MAKDSDKGLLGPFFYLWFGLSILLNVSGIASIVDGLVHWANFFRDFLDIYRHWIREPLSWAVHLVWPSWWPRIPPWVFDLFVIWSAFFFGLNAAYFKRQGRSAFSTMSDSVRDFVIALFLFVMGPFGLLFVFVGAYYLSEEAKEKAEAKTMARAWLLYTAAVFATVIVLAFLNWQFQHIGS